SYKMSCWKSKSSLLRGASHLHPPEFSEFRYGDRDCSRVRPSFMSSQYVPHTKVPTLVCTTSAEASRHVADMVANLIRQNNASRRAKVLGLPTGSTPIGMYRELIRLHKEADLDFSRVITFNLDEYCGLTGEDIHSYRRWMKESFFDHVNIPPENIHVPDGT